MNTHLDSNSKKEPQPLKVSKLSIEDYAEKISQEFKLTDFCEDDAMVKDGNSNDPLFVFVKDKLKGKIIYGEPDNNPFYRNDGDGSIFVEGPNDFTIFLPTYTGVYRDRFTVAHELGHYFLHSKQGEIKIVANRHGSGRVEWEANWFASSLLMPEKQFRDEYNKWKEDNSPLSPLYVLSAKFQISTIAVEYRMKNLGLRHIDTANGG